MSSFHQIQQSVIIADLLTALRAIPQHEKIEYVQALRVAPELVETESDPIAFLRFCNWDATAAARRLTGYWRKREEIFGEERAFLPLLDDFSGNGALRSEDVEMAGSGAYWAMPNDTHGRAVAYLDRTRFPPAFRHRRDVKLRSTFAALQHICRAPGASQTGFVLLVRGEMAIHSNDNKLEPKERKAHVQSALSFLLENFSRFFTSRIIVHACVPLEQIPVNLARHGISRESLPRFMGGLVETDVTASAVHPFSRYAPPVENHRELLATKPAADDNRFSVLDSFQSFHDASSKAGPDPPCDVTALEPEDLLLDPTALLPSPVQQPQVATPVVHGDVNATTPLNEDNTDSVLFAKMLDMPVSDPDGSPFDPIPIRSPSPKNFPNAQQLQHQPVATHPSTLTDLNFVNDVPFIETPHVHETSVAVINEALSGLSSTEHAGYDSAIRRAPVLVETESNPLAFLRFEEFNAWAAAKRLALHWNYRIEYFGDRAFFPLTQTMGGALWEEDIRTLSAGTFFFLPTDSKGRPVLCYDPSKCPGDVSKASLIRVTIYFFSILWRDYDVAMTEGCVILVFVFSGIMDLFNFGQNIEKATEIALDSFPIKKCETHVIYSPPPTASPLRSFVDILPKIVRALGPLLIHDGSHFHVGDTRDELERKLADCGLSGAGLRAAVSGGISDVEFGQWMRNRQMFEMAHSGIPALRQQQQQQQLQQPPVPPPQPTAPDDTAAVTITRRKEAPPVARGASVEYQQDINAAMQTVTASEKAAYVEAMEKVPGLVEKESDPVRFLKFENYDALAAARRLAAYWRIRREIFRSRAFSPLNQSASGALDSRDVAVLHSGFLTQLPNEVSGGSVVFCDGSRLEKMSPPSSYCRVFFYVWSRMSQNDLSQTVGCRVLFAMTEPSLDQGCIENLNLVLEAHPVGLKCFHLLGWCPDGVTESDFRQGPVKDTVKLLGSSLQEKVVVHVCGSRSGFASGLAGHGMSKDGLPEAFGGKWGLEDFLLLQELQLRHEWNLPFRASARQVAESYGIPTSTALPTSNLNDEEKTERKRRLNVIHSRRLRDRTRVQVHGLQEKCAELREEQDGLLREGRELEELLGKAKAVVDED